MTAVKNIVKDFYTVDDALTMDFEKIKQLQLDHLNRERTLAANAKYFKTAENSTFIDHKGQKHVDMIGAVGVCSVGNNNEFVWENLQKAFKAKNYMMGCVSVNNMAAVFAHDFALITPGQKLVRIQTATGGGEANEGALKLVKIATRNDPSRKHVLSTLNGFHGKTVATVTLGGKDLWKSFQGDMLPNVDHVPFGDADALEKALSTRKYCGFFVEPIQGEGGIIVPPDGYLKKARELCTKYGTYMVADEIQCGCARTGKMWACDWENVVPDCLVFAKGISGALIPFAGYACTEELWNAAYGSLETCFHHTATYQNNGLSAAAGIASLQYILEHDLADEAFKKGKYFLEGLKAVADKYPNIVKEVRGKGLMIGMEFQRVKKGLEEKYGEYYAVEGERYLQDEYRVQILHTINNPAVFRFLPPLTVPMEDIEYTIKAFEGTLKHLAAL